MADGPTFTVVLGNPRDPWVVRAFPPASGAGTITPEWFESFIRSGTFGQQLAAQELGHQLSERHHREVEEHRQHRGHHH